MDGKKVDYCPSPKVLVIAAALFCIPLHYFFALQKRIRKDVDSVKPHAAATMITGKRPPVAATRAPFCKSLAQMLFLELVRLSPRSKTQLTALLNSCICFYAFYTFPPWQLFSLGLSFVLFFCLCFSIHVLTPLPAFAPHTAKSARGMGAATVAVAPSRGKLWQGGWVEY